MHRITPSATAFRSYSAGGARVTVEEVDDKKLMQEMSGGFMKAEKRQRVEAPQNYGFTSVVVDADKEDDKIVACAEGFIAFMGGNRSFPVCTVMDDRRHRLKELDKGDTAMYRLKDDRQQFLMHEKGNFLSTREDKKNRFALVPKKDDKEQQGQQGQQQKKDEEGQLSVYEDNEKSETFIEQTKDEIKARRGDGYVVITDKNIYTYLKDEKISTRVTGDHVHIRFRDFQIWVNETGCFSTTPMTEASCEL